jgi:hypothetical protein
VGGPVVGGKGDAPEFGSGFEEFDADFGFAFGGGGDVNDFDELFFESVGVATENFLPDFDPHGQEEHCAVGVDVGGEGVFGDVLIVGAAADDEDGEAEQDALAAAAIMRGSGVGGNVGHGGRWPGSSVGEEEEEVKRRKVLMCAWGKGWSRRRESNPHGE